MPKTTYCPKCGSTRLQIEGARDEGRMAHCLDCGWGNWTNRLRYENPKRAKPPCENLVIDSRVSRRLSWNSFYCALKTCVNPESEKKVSCALSVRAKYAE